MINFLLRTFYYFRTGYSIYLNLPLAMISLTTTVYYLAIKNVPILQTLFPGMLEFGVTLILIIYPMGVLAGWFHFKKMPFYRIEQTINVESNPYSQVKLAPVMIPLWELLYDLGKREKLDEKILKDVKTIIDASN